MRTGFGAIFLWAAMFAAAPLYAADCPTAADGKRGFVVERGDGQKSEVFHADGHVVRTVMRYGGSVQLETTQFEGIFSLERIDRGKRTIITPQGNLAALFPLKVGRSVTMKFDFQDNAGHTTPGAIVLAVKSSEPLYVGGCKYNVLKIEHSEGHGGAAPRFNFTEYYSPDLKLVLMREYNDNGRSSVVKYDRIHPIQN